MQKNLCFSGAIWYHWVMRNAKEQTTSNEEMVTISRAEYENMQAQIQWLMEQLRLSRQKRFGASSEQTSEDTCRQRNWSAQNAGVP